MLGHDFVLLKGAQKETLKLRQRRLVNSICAPKRIIDSDESCQGSGKMSKEAWWDVVIVLARKIADGLPIAELSYDSTIEELTSLGFSDKDVSHAFDWLEIAARSGHINDVFSMLTPDTLSIRILSPMERAGIDDRLWRSLSAMKTKGIVGSDEVERLLEGIRTSDSRMWEDEEIDLFLVEVLENSLPQRSAPSDLNFTKGLQLSDDFYC